MIECSECSKYCPDPWYFVSAIYARSSKVCQHCEESFGGTELILEKAESMRQGVADGKAYPPQSKGIQKGSGLIASAHISGYGSVVGKSDSRVDDNPLNPHCASVLHPLVEIVEHFRDGILVNAFCACVP